MNRQHITISRPSSTQEEQDWIEIRIRDGRDIHKVTLTLQQYALAVSGMSHVPCVYEQNVVGSVHENYQVEG